MNKNTKDKAVVISFALAVLILFALCLFMPKESFSYSERRPLAQLPKFSLERILNGKFMSEFEKYSLDSFPMRDNFRTLKAVTAQNVFFKQDNNGIYSHNGFLSKVEYPLNEKSLEKAAERFKFVVDKYLSEGNKAYLSIIPDKNYFMAEKSGHLSLDYEKLAQMMSEKADFLTYIPIYDLLEPDSYYKTDTHWRQEKIVPVAEKLAEEMGVSLNGTYEEKLLPNPFYGVYKGQSALPFDSEEIRYLSNDVIDNAYVYDYQNNREIKVYTLDKADGKDAYEIFLGGPLSLVTMENKQAKEKKELVIFRDSFGSSIAPLFLNGYSKVTAVDIRYISPSILDKFVNFEGADMLFLYSTMVLNNSNTLK